jgi:Tol biopolymer transport system component
VLGAACGGDDSVGHPAQIAFMSDRQGAQADVYVMNADGTEVVNLTDQPTTDSTPKWSPDGTKIVYSSTVGTAQDILVIDLDGGSRREGRTEVVSPTGPRSYPPSCTRV